jgi:Tfp pilus assembly protein PilN
MNRSVKTPRSVVAAVKDDTRYKAVELRVDDGAVEVVWAKTMPGDGRTWSDFAAECGLVPQFDARRKPLRPDTQAVVGLDSTAVAFYRITAPAISEEETAAIVRMQAESLLPLPPDQIEVAWRTAPSADGKADVTIAAARSDHLERFADSVRDFRPCRILLSCEGLAKAWQRLFAGRERQAVVISVGEEHTQVCIIQAGHVVHAAVLDIGLSDLAPRDRAYSHQTAELTERFVQDMRTILDSFDLETPAAWPMFVLADGGERIDHVAASLNAAGLPVQSSRPCAADVKMPPDCDVYQYCTPLGLALLATDEADCLDLFAGILQDQTEAQTLRARYSVILAGAAAVLMLIVLLVTAYAVDKGRDNRYKELLAQTDLAQARQRQSLLKTVAQHRPDVLQLLADINRGRNSGIILDDFHFKKGQPVSVTGRADDEEQMWKFEENLRGCKGMGDVAISNATQDAKTKKIKFTMTFQYKTFTKKEAVL